MIDSKTRVLQSNINPIKQHHVQWNNTYDIKQQENRINLLLDKLKLVPEINPEKFFLLTRGYKHRYFAVCIDENKQKVIFNCLVRYDKLSIQSYQKELRFAQLINNPHFPHKDYLPTYLQVSQSPQELWFIQKYISYAILENKENMGQLAFPIKTQQIKNIANTMYDINTRLLKESYPKLTMHKFDIDNKITEIFQIILPSLKIKGFINESSIKVVERFIYSCATLVKRSNYYFVHGDFNLGNIFLSTSQNIKIIDWETYHQNNHCYDIAYLYSRLFREPAFRKKVVSEFFQLIPEDKKEGSKILFRFNILHLTLSYINYGLFIELTKKDFQLQRKWFIDLAKNNASKFSLI